jgi:hypothetical protein
MRKTRTQSRPHFISTKWLFACNCQDKRLPCLNQYTQHCWEAVSNQQRSVPSFFIFAARTPSDSQAGLTVCSRLLHGIPDHSFLILQRKVLFPDKPTKHTRRD